MCVADSQASFLYRCTLSEYQWASHRCQHMCDGCFKLNIYTVIVVYRLYVQVTVHHDNLHINNQQYASSIQNFSLSRNSTCFRHLLCPSSGVISCTCGNWLCFMQVMWPLPRRIGLELSLFQSDSPRQRPHNLHETYQLPRVQLITPDDGHRRCPKHVEFRDKIKLWILDASCWLLMRRCCVQFYNTLVIYTQIYLCYI